MKNAHDRAEMLRDHIEIACIVCGLNLAVHDGKIAFVDQKNRKIVGLWEPKYTMPDEKGGV